MMAAIRAWLREGRRRRNAVRQKIDELDAGQREVRHAVRNLQARGDYLRALLEGMRADQWAGKQ